MPDMDSAEIRRRLENKEVVTLCGVELTHPDQTPSDEDLAKIRKAPFNPASLLKPAPAEPFRPKAVPTTAEIDLTENGSGVPKAVIANTPANVPSVPATTAGGTAGPETSTGIPTVIHDRDLPPEETVEGGGSADKITETTETDEEQQKREAKERRQAEFAARPEVTVEDYKGIRSDKLAEHVTANEVELRAEYGDDVPEDRAGVIEALAKLRIAPPAKNA